MVAKALKQRNGGTRTRIVGKDGSSFVKCETCNSSVACSMAKLHSCAGADALLELVETKHEQMVNGKWVTYDPATTPIVTKTSSKAKATGKKAAPTKKKAAKRKQRDEEMDGFFNDVEEESDASGESEGGNDEDSSSEEEDDEEAALMRAAAAVIGAEEAGLDASPQKKAKTEKKKVAKRQEVQEQPKKEKKEKKDKEYVCCDSCGKWRGLPSFVDTEDLPDKWECAMMADILTFSRITCDSPQEPLPEGFIDEEQDDEEEDGEAGGEMQGEDGAANTEE